MSCAVPAVFNPTPNSTIDKEKKLAYVELANGAKCPLIALGTWKPTPAELTEAVKDALEVGIRHIDCAHGYENEKGVGVALKEKIGEGEGKIKRENVFITSKLWNTFHKPESVEPAIRNTLKDLQLDYLDLYIMHWPISYKEGTGEIFPKDADGKMQYSDACFVDTYKAMEKCVEKGLTKAIGVSNFNSKQLECILKVCKIRPVLEQIELNPYINQKKLRDFISEKKIAIGGYSVLGSGDRPDAKKNEPVLLQDPKLIEIAQKYKISPAQICIRLQLQRGYVAVAKAIQKCHIRENFDVFDFHISDEDVKEIESMEKGLRYTPFTWDRDNRDYPFNIEF